jgi:Glycosyl transferase family 2
MEDFFDAILDGHKPDYATAAIARMRSPRDMHIVCVDVTNRCDLQCSNCTRLLANQPTHWDMTPENFRTALHSLRGFEGVIAMIGGNPCLHKRFAELCSIFVQEVPNARQRGLWSNNVFDKQEIIAQTFGFFNLNPHNDPRGIASLEKLRDLIPAVPFYHGNSRHAPLLAAVRDVIADEGEMWNAIARCDINQHWSATIIENKGKLRAYFCEVAASFDLARGTDYGAPVVEGWWKRSIVDFADQVKHFCPGCGVPARLEARLDTDETDDYSATNADIARKTRGRRKINDAATLKRSINPVTTYNDDGAVPRAKISVIIPCYNGARTIEETIASVLAQELPHDIGLEIIVSDDGSTDESLAVVKAVAQLHPGKIAWLAASNNSGPAAARNRGLRGSTGEFVCFLDADDCYAPGFFLAALNAFAQEPKIAAVVSDIELVNLHRDVQPQHVQAMAACLPSNLMTRRGIVEIVGGFPEHPAFRGKSAGEDVAFRRVIDGNFWVGRITHPFLRYRIMRGSHFDLFMDSSEVVDGQLRITRLTQEDMDGTKSAAAQAYAASVAARLAAVEMCRAKAP